MSSGSAVERDVDDDAGRVGTSTPAGPGRDATTPDGLASGAPPTGDVVEGPVDDEDTGDTPDDRPRMVRFSIDDQSFLVDVAAVEEMLVAVRCTRLPGAAPAIVGVTRVRGRIVAVIDPRRLLVPGFGGSSPSCVLVISTADGPVGIVVDRVDQVVPAELSPVPPDDGRRSDAFVIAVAQTGGTLLPVIDPHALIDAALAVDDPAFGRSMRPDRP